MAFGDWLSKNFGIGGPGQPSVQAMSQLPAPSVSPLHFAAQAQAAAGAQPDLPSFNPQPMPKIDPPTNPAQAALYPHLMAAMQQSQAGNQPGYGGYQPGVGPNNLSPDQVALLKASGLATGNFGAGVADNSSIGATVLPNPPSHDATMARIIQGLQDQASAQSGGQTFEQSGMTPSQYGDASIQQAQNALRYYYLKKSAEAAAAGGPGTQLPQSPGLLGVLPNILESVMGGVASAPVKAVNAFTPDVKKTVQSVKEGAQPYIEAGQSIWNQPGDTAAYVGDLIGDRAKEIVSRPAGSLIDAWQNSPGATIVNPAVSKSYQWVTDPGAMNADLKSAFYGAPDVIKQELGHALSAPFAGTVMGEFQKPFLWATGNVGDNMYAASQGKDYSPFWIHWGDISGAVQGVANIGGTETGSDVGNAITNATQGASDPGQLGWATDPKNKAIIEAANAKGGGAAVFQAYWAATHKDTNAFDFFYNNLVAAGAHDPLLVPGLLAGGGERLAGLADVAGHADTINLLTKAEETENVARTAEAAAAAAPADAGLATAAKQARWNAVVAKAEAEVANPSAGTTALNVISNILKTPEHLQQTAMTLPFKTAGALWGALPPTVRDFLTNNPLAQVAKYEFGESKASKINSEIATGVDPLMAVANHEDDLINGTTPANGTTPFGGNSPAGATTSPFPPAPGMTPTGPTTPFPPGTTPGGAAPTGPTVGGTTPFVDHTSATAATDDLGGSTPAPVTTPADQAGTTAAAAAKPADVAPTPVKVVSNKVDTYVISDARSPVKVRVYPEKGTNAFKIQEYLDGKWANAKDESGNAIMGATYTTPYNPENLTEVQAAAQQVYLDKRLASPGGITPPETMTTAAPVAPAIDHTATIAEIDALKDNLGPAVIRVGDNLFVYRASDGKQYGVQKLGTTWKIIPPEGVAAIDEFATSAASAVNVIEREARKPVSTPAPTTSPPETAAEVPPTPNPPPASPPAPVDLFANRKPFDVQMRERQIPEPAPAPERSADLFRPGGRPLDVQLNRDRLPSAETALDPIHRGEVAPAEPTPIRAEPSAPAPTAPTQPPATEAKITEIHRMSDGVYDVHFDNGEVRTVGQSRIGDYRAQLATQDAAPPIVQRPAPVAAPPPTRVAEQANPNKLNPAEVFSGLEGDNEHPTVAALYTKDMSGKGPANSAYFDANVAKLPVEDVPLNAKIIATQDHLFARGEEGKTGHGVLDYAENKDLDNEEKVVAVRDANGDYHLVSGHHRVAGAMERGDATYRMHVAEEIPQRAAEAAPQAAEAEPVAQPVNRDDNLPLKEAAERPNDLVRGPAPKDKDDSLTAMRADPAQAQAAAEAAERRRAEEVNAAQPPEAPPAETATPSAPTARNVETTPQEAAPKVAVHPDATFERNTATGHKTEIIARNPDGTTVVVDKASTWQKARDMAKERNESAARAREAAAVPADLPEAGPAVQAYIEQFPRGSRTPNYDPNAHIEAMDQMATELGHGNPDAGDLQAARIQRALEADPPEDPYAAARLRRPDETTPQATPAPSGPSPVPTDLRERVNDILAPKSAEAPAPEPVAAAPVAEVPKPPGEAIPQPEFTPKGYPKGEDDRFALRDLIDKGHLTDTASGRFGDLADGKTAADGAKGLSVNEQVKVRKAWEASQEGVEAAPKAEAAPVAEAPIAPTEPAPAAPAPPRVITEAELAKQDGETANAYQARLKQIRADQDAGRATLETSGETSARDIAAQNRAADLKNGASPFEADARKVVNTHLIDRVEQMRDDNPAGYQKFHDLNADLRAQAAEKNAALQSEIDQLKREQAEHIAANKENNVPAGDTSRAAIQERYGKINKLIVDQSLNGIETTVTSADHYRQAFGNLPEDIPATESGVRTKVAGGRDDLIAQKNADGSLRVNDKGKPLYADTTAGNHVTRIGPDKAGNDLYSVGHGKSAVVLRENRDGTYDVMLDRASDPVEGGSGLTSKEAIAKADETLPVPKVDSSLESTPALLQKLVYKNAKDADAVLAKRVVPQGAAGDRLPVDQNQLLQSQLDQAKDLQTTLNQTRLRAKPSLFDGATNKTLGIVGPGYDTAGKITDIWTRGRKDMRVEDTTVDMTVDQKAAYAAMPFMAQQAVNKGVLTVDEAARIARPVLDANGHVSTMIDIYDNARVLGKTKIEATTDALKADEIDIRSGINPADRTMIESLPAKKRAVLMEKIEKGTPLSAEEKRLLPGLSIKDQNRYRGGAERAVRGWDGINNIAKENMQFNVWNGMRGLIQNKIQDYATMALTGNARAIVQDIRDMPTIIRSALDSDPTRLVDMPMLTATRESGVTLPRRFINGKWTETAQGMQGEQFASRSSEMRLKSAIDRKVGVETGSGSAGDTFTKVITRPFASKLMKDLRTATQEASKIGVFENELRQLTPGINRSFENELMATYGPSRATAMMDDIRAAAKQRIALDPRKLDYNGGFSAEDVRSAGVNEQFARLLTGGLKDAADTAAREAERVFFTYKQANLDSQLSHAIMFNYWASRQSFLFADIALHHPFFVAQMERVWTALGQDAQNSGTSNRLTMWLHLMGNSPYGMGYLVDPLRSLVATQYFQNVSNPNDPWWKRAGVLLTPLLDGVMASVGFSNDVPNLFGVDAVTHELQLLDNELKAHGVGSMSFTPDLSQVISKALITGANSAAKSIAGLMHVKVGDYQPYNPAAGMTASVRSLIHQYAEADHGPEFDGKNNLLWSPEVEAKVADADLRAGQGAGFMEDNPYSKKAYAAYAGANFNASLLNLVVPTTARANPLDAMRVTAKAGQANLDAGKPETPEQVNASKTKSLIEAGTPAGYNLRVQNTLSTQIPSEGNDWGAFYNKAHQEILYGNDPASYFGDSTQTDQHIALNAKITAMSPQDRAALFQQYMLGQGATRSAQYDKWVADHKAVVNALPEESVYHSWQVNIGQIKANPALWREYLQENPGYKAYLDQFIASLPAATRDDPNKLATAVDAASMGENAYWAAMGQKGSIYDTSQPQKGDDPMGAKLLGTGTGATTANPGSNLTPEQVLTKQIDTYNKEVNYFDAALQAYTHDPNVHFAGALPNERVAYERILGKLGIIKPRLTLGVKRYLYWLNSGAANGTDRSVHAFSAWLAGQKETLAGLVDPNNPLTQIDYNNVNSAYPTTNMGIIMQDPSVTWNPGGAGIPSGNDIMGGGYQGGTSGGAYQGYGGYLPTNTNSFMQGVLGN